MKQFLPLPEQIFTIPLPENKIWTPLPKSFTSHMCVWQGRKRGESLPGLILCFWRGKRTLSIFSPTSRSSGGETKKKVKSMVGKRIPSPSPRFPTCWISGIEGWINPTTYVLKKSGGGGRAKGEEGRRGNFRFCVSPSPSSSTPSSSSSSPLKAYYFHAVNPERRGGGGGGGGKSLVGAIS